MTYPERCLSILQEALATFGTYSFDDQGPGSVLNLRALALDARSLPVETLVRDLIALAHSSACGGRGFPLAAAIVGELEDWDALFEHPVVAALYNIEMPDNV